MYLHGQTSLNQVQTASHIAVIHKRQVLAHIGKRHTTKEKKWLLGRVELKIYILFWKNNKIAHRLWIKNELFSYKSFIKILFVYSRVINR